MIERLNTTFKDILYLDSRHQYFHSDGTELQSITKFLSSLKPKFEERFWSTYKAYQFSGYEVKAIWNNFQEFHIVNGDKKMLVFLNDDHSYLKVTPEDVLEQWRMDNLIGTSRGSYIHQYLEHKEQRRSDKFPKELPLGISTPQAVNYINSLKVAEKLCQEFLDFATENLILIAAEYWVGDKNLGLAGTFDRLYFNKISKEFEIWDFKTDKQLRYKSSFGKLDIFDLPDCEFEKYSLQTSFYKKIIEDNLQIKIGKSHIVWFNLKDEKMEILPCNDYTQLITNNYADHRTTHIEHTRND